jgi:4'-phosphopantetheinyl transferase
MDPRQTMKLRPRSWNWDGRWPGSGWLDGFSRDLPAVWEAGLTEDGPTLSKLTSPLSVEERTTLERFRGREDQKRFLIGRGLLRLLIGAHMGMPAQEVEFIYGPAGKPRLAPRPGVPALHFNVAHSGKLVLLAFHPAREVGVDVEEMRTHRDQEGIAERVFTAREFEDWKRLNPSERYPAFYRLWTRHEARLKTLGVGFSGDSNPAENRVTLFDLELAEGYQGAVGWLRD